MSVLALLLAQAVGSPPEEQVRAAPGESAGGSAEGSEWVAVDGVAAQAGERILTVSSFSSFVRGRLGDRAISTQDELERELSRALDASLTRMLETQAGEDMGLKGEAVQRFLAFDERDKRQNLGPTGFLDYLEEQGLDGLDAQERRAEELSVFFWRNTITGGRTLPGERPVRDPFVRPGELRSIYRQNRADLGAPDQVQFQVFELPSAAAGGDEEALAICEEVRGRALAGEELEELMLEFGVMPREGDGVTPVLVIDEIQDVRTREFARAAAAGEISPVLPFEGPEGKSGYLLLKLHARREGSPPPPFEDRRVQEYLRFEFQRRQREVLLADARGELRREAYLWLHPRFRGEESDPAGDRSALPSSDRPAGQESGAGASGPGPAGRLPR